MRQDKQAKEEEGKGGQQAELNSRKGGSQWVRGRRDARLVAVALPQALPEALAGISP
jgi:hypothetical protein